MNITSQELNRLQNGLPIAKKQSKYRNSKIVCERGIKWDSRKEMDYFYGTILTLEYAKEITELSRQVKYEIIVNGVKICTYIADFTYVDKQGNKVVIDVKSAFTRKLPVYRLKKKLMKACFGIEIKEV